MAQLLNFSTAFYIIIFIQQSKSTITGRDREKVILHYIYARNAAYNIAALERRTHIISAESDSRSQCAACQANVPCKYMRSAISCAHSEFLSSTLGIMIFFSFHTAREVKATFLHSRFRLGRKCGVCVCVVYEKWI